MKIGQEVFITPTYAKGNKNHKDTEIGKILTIATEFCFVSIGEKIEIVDKKLIVM